MPMRIGSSFQKARGFLAFFMPPLTSSPDDLSNVSDVSDSSAGAERCDCAPDCAGD
ncbi:hypothetical protein GCM10010513_67050 [Streptomyces glebosus]|nr:hypothetical protein GCM10010513_67050 [Streptomyces glebosus]